MSTPYVTSSHGATTTSGQDPIAGNGQQDNTFLTLMIAQIQNQTPLDPLDTTQFMTQLAQMTQVETMQNMNSTVVNQMVLLDNIQVLTTAGMVGQDVRVTTDTLELEGNPLDAVIELGSAVDDLKVEIRNDAGELVDTIELGANSEGEVTFVIDPKSMELKDGQYDLTVVTNDSDYKPEVMITGTIERMRIPPGGGSPEFLISGVGYVPFFNVSQYGETHGSDSQSPEPTPLFTLAGRR
ncbi:flagellar hook capping FlgD N-terminal domain-containing protein [Photobacterium lutimaris]|uniref:Basal-body rod modification protein FlgD n=1 Tax=Photobacterium lutimaris TaxID=388278 RepID=A0A2T3IV70_9GAMM|nr:flagellar hook capping FlgD N-terminal domain-containing protein [Photobacterium lutimaris]PSU32295.1 flagellar basal body rod modification protein [Photobacterium lutimaris]TDR73169.1 flagellar basal-body rod modification protein FlgD [Photobacterium lutimaris]